MESFETYILLGAIIFGVAGALIAHWKGKNKVLWFVICAITNIFGLLIILIIPKSNNAEATNKKIGLKKMLSLIGILLFAVISALLLENKKTDIATSAKTSLITSCAGDSDCINVIEAKFEQCFNKAVSIEKTNKKSRDVDLDITALQQCIHE